MRSLFSLVCLLGFSQAHTTFTNFFINGVAQGDGTCVRMSQTPNNATFPLPNIQAPEMACGVNGDIGVARVCKAPAGALMTFEFRERPDGATPGAIDKSHKGPIAVYMKKVADPTANGTAAGGGWFKIFQQDFNNTSQKWATETLIANKGLLSVSLPKSLVGGYYLVRTELLALHEADKSPPDPQFYVGCAQIFLQGGGSAQPSDAVKIPGYISFEKNNAALTFNIYKQPMALPYPMFGPAVFTGTTTNQKAVVKSTEQTLGLKPDDCVLANANWCGRELTSFSTEQGCWNASTACWAQCKDCYSSAPPTGSANCQIWERKCKGIQDQCNSGNLNGPPNRMKDLTPASKKVQVPSAACDDASAAAATGSASRLFTLQQPTASASDGAGADQTTTLHRTTFKTVTKSASPSASENDGEAADATTTIHRTSIQTKTILLQTAPSSSAAAPSSSQQTSPAAAAASGSGSTYASGAASGAAAATPAVQPDIGPDAFGSVDECGARNASAHCGGGLCCSQFGYCGGTPLHCGIGCQDGFGACDQLPANANETATATTSALASGSTSCTPEAAASGASGTIVAAASAAAASSTAEAGGAAASSTIDAASPTPAAGAADGTNAANPVKGGGGDGGGGDPSTPPAATTSPSASSSAAPPAAAPSQSASPPPPPAAPKLPEPAPPVAKPTSSVTVVVLGVKLPSRVKDA